MRAILAHCAGADSIYYTAASTAINGAVNAPLPIGQQYTWIDANDRNLQLPDAAKFTMLRPAARPIGRRVCIPVIYNPLQSEAELAYLATLTPGLEVVYEQQLPMGYRAVIYMGGD
jgi:hypothetical protein